MKKRHLVILLFCQFCGVSAQGDPGTTQWDVRIEELLYKANNEKDFIRLVNLIVWDSEILVNLPSISPVRKQDTRNLRSYISSPFGTRKHPIFHNEHFHSGIDIPGKERDTIYAPGNGIVKDIGFENRLGGFIRIRHKYRVTSVFGHMRKALCQTGDTIAIGQPIGLMGNTGSSTGPHLHYTVKLGDQYVNPIPFCYLMFDYLKRKKQAVSTNLPPNE